MARAKGEQQISVTIPREALPRLASLGGKANGRPLQLADGTEVETGKWAFLRFEAISSTPKAVNGFLHFNVVKDWQGKPTESEPLAILVNAAINEPIEPEPADEPVEQELVSDDDNGSGID